MRTRILVTAVCVSGSMLFMTCGESQAPPGPGAIEKALPAEFAELELARDGDIMVFEGDSLFNYIDGAAEMYHKYGFVDVHVARYRRDEGEITVDIYRFAGDDLAFGMYSTLRPEDPEVLDLGAEGFTFGPVLIFAKDPYMVNVQTYDDAVFLPCDVKAVAEAVNENLPGAESRPAIFDLFPKAGQMPHSEKVIAEAFLGRAFLTDVYTVDYSTEGGEVTLFLAHDQGGQKLMQWSEAAPPPETGTGLPAELAYDPGTATLISETYYGSIAAGTVNGLLAGAVPYAPANDQMLRQLLESIKPTAP